MSVRRLAEESVQPDSFAFNRANGAWAKRKIKDFPKGRQASAVIPLLMRAQEQEGWVTKAAIEHVAEMLDMPLIRVLEVATFYTQFQLAPVGKRAHIQVCGTTPCMLRGSDEIMDVCKKRIAPNPFELSEDGNLSWEEVECQGACVNAPMVMIFKDSYEDLTPTQMEHIIDRFNVGKGDEITPGPQIDRIYSAPEGGLTSLTETPGKPSKRSQASASKAPAKAKALTKAKPAAKIAGNVGTAAAKVTAKKSVAEKASTKTEDAKKSATKKVASKKPTTKKADGVKVTPKKVATKKADSTKAETKQAATKKSAAKKSDNAKASTKKTTAKKPAAKEADAGKPAGMKKPSQIDDLKQISGVGPKIEGILHKLGVYKFEQVSKWKKAERDWVDDYLSFKGRIEREDWVKQAKALAKKVK